MTTDELRRSVDRAARRRWLSALAPLVELFAATPGEQGGGALRLSTRKVIAFDNGVYTPLVFAAIPGFYAGTNMVGGLIDFAQGREHSGVYAGIAGLIFVTVVLLGTLFSGRRLAALRRDLARFVVVPARVTHVEKTGSWWNRYSPPRLTLYLEYVYSGAHRRATESLPPDVGRLVGVTPALLVDPADPERVLLRDLYV